MGKNELISVIGYFLNDIFTLQGMYGFVEYLGYIWDQKISVWEEFCSKLSDCHYGTKFHTSWWPGNIWSTMQDIILNSNSSIKLPVGCEFITYTVEKHPTFFVHSSFLLLPLTQERQRNEKTSSGGHSPKNGNRTTFTFYRSSPVLLVPPSFEARTSLKRQKRPWCRSRLVPVT